MQSDFSSFDGPLEIPADTHPHVDHKHHHYASHHHVSAPETTFSVLKGILIAGPLVFVLVLVVITAVVQKNNTVTPEVLFQEELTPETMEQTPVSPSEKGYLCGNDIHIFAKSESPLCPNYTNTQATSYTSSYTVKNTTPLSQAKRYRVTLRMHSNFCMSGLKTEGVDVAQFSCYENPQDSIQTIELGPQESKTITITRSHPTRVMSSAGSPACGAYQEDMYVQEVMDLESQTFCNLENTDPNSFDVLVGSGRCSTQNDCTAITQ